MKQKIGYSKLGGITFVISGILFFAQYLFSLPIPTPPAKDQDLIRWISNWKFNISMMDELFFFATLFLIPSIIALYRELVKVDKIKAMIGCSLLVVIIPINSFLDIVLGRLVYPVYNIELTPDIYRYVLSVYHGGMHSVAIIFSVATIVIALILRKMENSKLVANYGFVVGILDLVGAYPWIIGTALTFLTQLFFSAWFVMLGIWMLRNYAEQDK